MLIALRSLIFVLLVLCSVAPASAATYYVAPAGKDSNPGTQAAPWKTIQKAAASFRAGDTIIIAGGRYYEQVSITRDGPVTFQAAPGATVTIDGRNPPGTGLDNGSSWSPATCGSAGCYTATYLGRGGVVWINGTRCTPVAAGSNQNTVDGPNECYFSRSANRFYLRLPGNADPDAEGTVIQAAVEQRGFDIDTVDNITIDGIDIIGTWEHGVSIWRGDNITVKNSKITQVGFTEDFTRGYEGRGIRSQGSEPDPAKNNKFQNVTINDVGRDGITMLNYAVDNVVENCSITGNKFHAGITVLSVQGAVPARNIIRNNVVRDIKDDGIMIQGCNGCVIERNIVEDAGREGIWLSPGDPGPNNLNSPLGRSNIVRSNVIARARNGIEIDRNTNPIIVNNTAIQNRDAGLHAISDTTGMVVRNNIFAWNTDQSMNVTGSVGDRAHSIDYNLYFPGKIRWEGDPPNGPNCNGGCAYQTLAAFRNAGFTEYAQKSIEADPQLIDPAGDQFGLLQGSPAVDRGIPIGLPYSGSAPDLGALEFGGSGGGGDPPPPPPILLSVEPLAN